MASASISIKKHKAAAGTATVSEDMVSATISIKKHKAAAGTAGSEDGASNDDNRESVASYSLPSTCSCSSSSTPHEGEKTTTKSRCRVCGTETTRICGRCRSASYCSVACQIAHRPTHRLVCRAPLPRFYSSSSSSSPSSSSSSSPSSSSSHSPSLPSSSSSWSSSSFSSYSPSLPSSSSSTSSSSSSFYSPSSPSSSSSSSSSLSSLSSSTSSVSGAASDSTDDSHALLIQYVKKEERNPSWPELDPRFQLDANLWQSMVSGEGISVSVKPSVKPSPGLNPYQPRPSTARLSRDLEIKGGLTTTTARPTWVWRDPWQKHVIREASTCMGGEVQVACMIADYIPIRADEVGQIYVPDKRMFPVVLAEATRRITVTVRDASWDHPSLESRRIDFDHLGFLPKINVSFGVMIWRRSGPENDTEEEMADLREVIARETKCHPADVRLQRKAISSSPAPWTAVDLADSPHLTFPAGCEVEAAVWKREPIVVDNSLPSWSTKAIRSLRTILRLAERSACKAGGVETVCLKDPPRAWGYLHLSSATILPMVDEFTLVVQYDDELVSTIQNLVRELNGKLGLVDTSTKWRLASTLPSHEAGTRSQPIPMVLCTQSTMDWMAGQMVRHVTGADIRPRITTTTITVEAD